MKSDFELVQFAFPERQDLTILPIADVHLGAAEHLEREWRQFCDSVLKQPNTYLLLGGDMVNNSTRSSVANPFDEVIRPREQKRLMAEMLMPLRERILAGVLGNHEMRSRRESDVDIMADIFCKLDIEERYRQNLAVIKIQIGDSKADGNRNPTYAIALTHGTGGGIYTGSAINRGERYAYYFDGIDALVLAHTHKAFVTQPAKLKVDPFNNKVSVKPFKVVSVTGWLEYGGYVAQKMLQPSSYAPQIMHLCGTKKELTVTM